MSIWSLKILVTALWGLASVFLVAFLLGLLPLMLSALGLSGFALTENIFAFLWATVAFWFYRIGAPESIVSTGTHVMTFFSALGYSLVYLVPAVAFGAIAWSLNRLVITRSAKDSQEPP